VRVFVATPYPAGSATGVGAFVRLHRDHLLRDGHESLLVEPRGDEPAVFANLFLAVRSTWLLIRNRRRVDIVHGNQLHLQSLLIGLAARLLGKGLIVTVHGRSPRPKGLRGLAFDAIEWWTLRIPHEVVFVASSLCGAFGGRGIVIPNGVPVDAIRALRPARDAVRVELGLRDAFVILYVGRVTVDKGIPVLLEAFDAAKRASASPLRLVLVGPVDADMWGHVASRSNGVVSLGVRADVWRLLAAGDLFVLPSTREGLPLSLLEAMASGLPAIASRVGDIPRAVRQGSTGMLVTPGDVAELTHAIKKCAGDPDLRRAMGREAADLMARDFEFGKVVDAYVELYAKIQSW